MPTSLLTVTPLTASGISHVFDNIPYGPFVWVDASKISGIASNASLSAWTDVSGSGNHLLNSGASRPFYQTNVINGLPAVIFSTATKAFMQASYTTIADPFTFVVAGAASSLVVDSASTTNRCRIAASGGSFIINNVTTLSQLNAADSAQHIHVGIFNGSSSTYRVDGNSHVTTGNAGTTGDNGLTVGADNTVAAFSFNTMGEILVYQRALSASEITLVETYLAAKWGITVT